MAYIDLPSVIHNSTKPEYLACVNDIDYPKSGKIRGRCLIRMGC